MSSDSLQDRAWALDRAFGGPAQGRRLGDRLLAAFARAYAGGLRRLPGKLAVLLSFIDRRRPATAAGEPRPAAALGAAEHWRDFVDACRRYREMTENPHRSAGGAARALAEMADAYRRWIAAS
jgi:hypothetical protein